MDDLSNFCCQNEGCREYGKQGAGNWSVCMRYGRNKVPLKRRRAGWNREFLLELLTKLVRWPWLDLPSGRRQQ
jgi:hypothetical protein